jgi:succinate dehydrogenase hydrophobic anchor subunit
VSDEPAPVLHRGWISADAWRGTRVGLWAWLLQRAAAVALVVAVILHLRNPFVRWVQALVLALVLLHGLLGVRVILLDVGVPVRLHAVLFATAVALAGVLFVLVWWWWRWY